MAKPKQSTKKLVKTTKGPAKKAPRASAAKQPKATAPAPLPTDPKKAYEALLDRANALAPGEVPVTRISPSIARTNVDRAVAAMKPHFAELVVVAPTIPPSRLLELPAIARALGYAEKRVPVEAASGTVDEVLGVVSPLRLAALSYLDSAAFCGLVDPGLVRAIRAGSGRLDLARDAVAIAGLFEDDAEALQNKHPFTDEQLATLRDQGAWLADHIKPSGTVRDPRKRHPAALIKDRFAKLLEDGYADLLKAAVALWGVDDYRAHVPALLTQERNTATKRARKKTKPAPAATKPTPADTAPATKAPAKSAKPTPIEETEPEPV